MRFWLDRLQEKGYIDAVKSDTVLLLLLLLLPGFRILE